MTIDADGASTFPAAAVSVSAGTLTLSNASSPIVWSADSSANPAAAGSLSNGDKCILYDDGAAKAAMGIGSGFTYQQSGSAADTLRLYYGVTQGYALTFGTGIHTSANATAAGFTFNETAATADAVRIQVDSTDRYVFGEAAANLITFDADATISLLSSGASFGLGVGTLIRAATANTGELSMSYANASTAAGTTVIATGVGTTATADDANTGIVTETFAPTFTVAANTLQAGAVVRLYAEGILTTDAAAGNLTVLFVFGGTPTTLVTTGAQTIANNLTNARWTFSGYGTCRSTGAAGTIMPGGTFTLWTAATTSQSWQLTTTAAVTYDTTAAQAWGLRTTADDAGTVITSQQVVPELLPQ